MTPRTSSATVWCASRVRRKQWSTRAAPFWIMVLILDLLPVLLLVLQVTHNGDPWSVVGEEYISRVHHSSYWLRENIDALSAYHQTVQYVILDALKTAYRGK